MGSHRVGHDWSDLAAAVAASLLAFKDILPAILFSLSTRSFSLSWIIPFSCYVSNNGKKISEQPPSSFPSQSCYKVFFFSHQLLLSPHYFFSPPCSLQDLSFPNRDWTCNLSSESRVLTTGPPGDSLQLCLKLTVLILLQLSPPIYVTVPVKINNDLHIFTSYRQFSIPFYLFFW